jgi:hypothetical protein
MQSVSSAFLDCFQNLMVSIFVHCSRNCELLQCFQLWEFDAWPILAMHSQGLSREACNLKLEASLFWPSKIISNIYIYILITYTTCISEKYVWTFYVWSCMIFVVSTPWFLDGRRVSSAPRGKISLRILHWGGSPQSHIWFSALRLAMATSPGRIH